jgi:hypothetical protein
VWTSKWKPLPHAAALRTVDILPALEVFSIIPVIGQAGPPQVVININYMLRILRRAWLNIFLCNKWGGISEQTWSPVTSSSTSALRKLGDGLLMLVMEWGADCEAHLSQTRWEVHARLICAWRTAASCPWMPAKMQAWRMHSFMSTTH